MTNSYDLITIFLSTLTYRCSRKSSRGLTRNQRRKRSKSPILHPPKFTYCSSKLQFKHKSPTELEDTSTSLLTPKKKEILFSSTSSPIFSSIGYDSSVSLESISPLNRVAPFNNESSLEGKDEKTNNSLEEGQAPAADFKSLCQLQESGMCQCTSWQGMEVYSFTGLRDVISECERKIPSSQDVAQNTRTVSASVSSSPRSCSEQARVYVDDVTIEDLSGYMEYYLYIPKKMSHMAEMMYT